MQSPDFTRCSRAGVVRRLSHAVLDHGGPDLRDDSNLLLVRWSGPRRAS